MGRAQQMMMEHLAAQLRRGDGKAAEAAGRAIGKIAQSWPE